MLENQTWTATVTLPRTPHCPVCGQPMEPRRWHSYKGVVYCEECHTNPHGRRLATVNAILENPNRQLLTRRLGLWFYVPTTGYPPTPALPNLPTAPYIEHPRERSANATRVPTR